MTPEAALATLTAAREQVQAAHAKRSNVHLLRWGRRAYQPVLEAMRAYTDTRDEHSPDQFWCVEHEPVYTLGQAGKWEHVLAPGEIEVLRVERGGQVTYHGPGQLVLYPMLDLRRLKLGIRVLVEALEQASIDTLASFAITAARKQGAPGIYVAGRKIMALGLRVRRGASFHGMALNVGMDLEPFQRINPCGFQGLEVTDMAAEGGPANLDVVASALVPRLADLLGLNLLDASEPRSDSDFGT